MRFVASQAYLYHKKSVGFYTRSEVVNVPPGFYQNWDELVAAVNLNLTMRGERNGYIYHLYTKRTADGLHLGVAATHRQPEPSVLHVDPMIDIFGQKERLELELRTNRRQLFEMPVYESMAFV